LIQAQAIASDSGLLSGDRKSGAYADKEVVERNISDASIVLSLLNLERGNPRSALLHARRSLRIMARAWRGMERQQKADIQSSQTSPVESPDSTVNLSMSMNVTGIVSTVEKQSLGPSAWGLIRPMFRSLAHLSRIYAHHGMFQDTIYYAEQAHKIATIIKSSHYIAEALALTGSTWLRAGTLDKASEQLLQARGLSASLKETQFSVLVNAHLGMLHNMNGDKAAELAVYNDAESTLKVLLDSKYISDLDRIVDAAAELEIEMSRLALENRKTPAVRKVAVRRTVAVKKGEPLLKAVAEASMSASQECLTLMSLKGVILRQKAKAYLLWRRCDEAMAILKEATSLSCGQMDAIDHHVSLARQYFLQSADQMASDPVYSVLQDSTISFPAVICTSKAITSERLSGTKASPPSKKSAAVSGRNPSRARGSTTTNFFDNLRQAQDHLWEAYHVAAQVSSTAVIHTIATILNATVILLSAAGPSKGKSVVHPIFATASLGTLSLSIK
jgi:separase